MKARGSGSHGGEQGVNMVCICYRLPSQEKVDKAFLKQLEEAS